MSSKDNVFKRVDWPAADGWVPSDDDDEHGLPVRPSGSGLSDADLDLLTLAAHALGAVQVEPIEGEQWVNLRMPDGSMLYAWNPLLHGDDTLNLAADLDIDVFQSAVDREARAVAPMQRVINVPWGGDKRAATKRAITRAAAEIAVAKENKQA